MPETESDFIQFQILGSTAGQEIRQAIDASGEPPMEQLRAWYDDVQTEPSSSAEFWRLCQRRQDFREAYQQYWMSSRERTIQKRVVDGVIMPVAPSASVQEGSFSYYGKEHRTQRSPFRLMYYGIKHILG